MLCPEGCSEGDRDEDIPSRGNMLSGTCVADTGIRVEGMGGASEPVPGGR